MNTGERMTTQEEKDKALLHYSLIDHMIANLDATIRMTGIDVTQDVAAGWTAIKIAAGKRQAQLLNVMSAAE